MSIILFLLLLILSFYPSSSQAPYVVSLLERAYSWLLSGLESELSTCGIGLFLVLAFIVCWLEGPMQIYSCQEIHRMLFHANMAWLPVAFSLHCDVHEKFLQGSLRLVKPQLQICFSCNVPSVQTWISLTVRYYIIIMVCFF